MTHNGLCKKRAMQFFNMIKDSNFAFLNDTV